MIGTHDYASRLDNRILNILKDEFNCIDGNYVSNNFERLAEIIRRSYGLPPPLTLSSAINIFKLLLQIFDE